MMEGSDTDGLSVLPDFLVHEILSFLAIKDVARTSLVSKRFRHLCMCVPDLNIDPKPCKTILSRHSLCNWTDRYIFLRNGAKIRRFGLYWSCHDHAKVPQQFRFDTWIHNAVKCNVEELDLSFVIKEGFYQLPLCIFGCKSLRVFKLKLQSDCVLNLPSNFSTCSYCFSAIQVLSIPKVQLHMKLPENWVSSLFPSLKVLNLDDGLVGCNNLNINTSSLECLTVVMSSNLHTLNVNAPRLDEFSVSWWCRSSSDPNISLTIFAPNLQKLKWDGYLIHIANYCCQVGSLPSATISPSYSYDDVANGNYLNIPRNCFLGIFEIISQAKSVKLGHMFMELLFAQDSLPVPHLLNNVEKLDIQVFSIKDHRVAALAAFLRRLPNLKSLTITCRAEQHVYSMVKLINSMPYRFDIDYWESQQLAFIHQLKAANLEIMEVESEIELVKYLIKHGKALEKMIVTASPECKGRYRQRIRRNISKFKNTHNGALHLVLK